MEKDYLLGITKQFEYYKLLGDKTFEQLSDQQFFWKYNEESNSISNIVKHLSGNMLSRWTDFLISDGEKNWRNREEEFFDENLSRDEVIARWNIGWECLFATIQSLKPENLDQIIYIRNQGHTVMEAINRQLAHYPYHVGQIVFIGKMITNNPWTSLSIPKGNSTLYNEEKFSKMKEKTHFTDEYLGKKSI